MRASVVKEASTHISDDFHRLEWQRRGCRRVHRTVSLPRTVSHAILEYMTILY